MGTWPIYKKLQLILTKKKLSFDKISPRDFYFFPFFSICTCIHFTLGRLGKLAKQAALWRWLSELMINAQASWCDSTGSKSKKHDKIFIIIGTWYSKFDIFFKLGHSSQKNFVWFLLGLYARVYGSHWLTSRTTWPRNLPGNVFLFMFSSQMSAGIIRCICRHCDDSVLVAI